MIDMHLRQSSIVGFGIFLEHFLFGERGREVKFGTWVFERGAGVFKFMANIRVIILEGGTRVPVPGYTRVSTCLLSN